MKSRLTAVLLLYLFYFLSTKANAQELIVNFASNVTKGCGSINVSFVNQSTPSSGLSYFWDFGNGVTSIVSNPNVLYTAPGNFDVSLVISDGSRSATITRKNYITVFQKPKPTFVSKSGTSGCVPLNIEFNNQTVEGDTAINLYHWDFGDGFISASMNPVHVFNYQDTYSVSLYVRDKNNCENLIIYDDYIAAYQPAPAFSCSDSVSCNGSLTARFNNHSTGIGNLKYNWNFGNNTSSIALNPEITYTTNGIFDVQLIATDGHNCSDTLLKEDLISIELLKAEFKLSKDTFCLEENIAFTNISSNTNISHWDFGDGITSGLVNPTHKYSVAKDYTVKFIATGDKACSSIFTKIINVEKVLADYSSSKTFGCESEVVIHYSDNSINAAQWDWRFGNNIKSNLKNPTNTYKEEGTYIDTLIITSKHGCKNAKVVNPGLTLARPHAYFIPNNWVEINSIKGCTPLTVNFTDQSAYLTNKDALVSWQWDFGDGSSSTSKNPSHVFQGTANYQVSLKLTTEKGCVSYYGATAKTGAPQNADFIKDAPNIICASTPVQFTDKSENKDLIKEWYWIFGDGTTSTKQNPLHIFADTGYMEVKLNVYHNGCPDDNIKPKFIYIKGPIVKTEYLTTCANPLSASFKSNAIIADKMYWNFNDGTSIDSINPNPVHNYNSRGDYKVHLKAVNNSNGCSFEMQTDVLIRKIKAIIQYDKKEGCPGLKVNFNPEGSVDEYNFVSNGQEAKYLWAFGDGTGAFNSAITFPHQFNLKGSYPVKLKVSDFRGCQDSVVQQINIYKPEPLYVADNFTGCMPMSVDFVNKTISEAPVANWLWEFGDNTTSIEKNPKHVYSKYGRYSVTLSVTDNIGCSNKLTKSDFIEALKPSPDFTVSDRTSCIGDTLLFLSQAKDSIRTYKWDFGDGTTSSLPKPTHIYTTKGLYNISLRLIDAQGCDSIKTMVNYIDLQEPPKVKFEADETFTNCFPLVVHFTDKSEGSNINKWDWSFEENQSTAKIQNPIHTFTKPGIYDVSLRAYTSNGCSNFISKDNMIEIRGPWAKINAPDTICKNSAVSLMAVDKINAYDLIWFFNDGTIDKGDSVKHIFTSHGNNTVALLVTSDDLHTCDKYFIDTMFMSKLKASIFENEKSQSGCVPFSINFINQSVGAKSFDWTFGDGGSSKIPTPLYTYKNDGNFNSRLIAFNPFGCADTSYSKITVQPLPKIKIIKDTLICKGQSIRLWASGAKSYTWFPGKYLDSDDIYNPVSSPDKTIDYEVMGVDTNNCVNYSNTNIAIQQIPVITVPDTTIIIGETVSLNAYFPDLLSYKWTPFYGLSNNNTANIKAQPLESTIYELTVVDTNRCFTVTEEISIQIRKEYTVDVPSAFTPNGDGVNDKIFIKGWGVKDVVDFKIFNRFGELVFESHDKNEGWDGSHKGNNQNIETYTYYAKILTYEDEIKVKTGAIKLLK